jgi:2OG-Fe(II) oxygenase superfamily
MHFDLEEICRQLAGIGAPGSFATQSTLPADALHLEVKGVGSIRLPVSAAAARKLCAVARPAHHGFKDQTRLDPKVRNSWEIPKSRISIDQRRWKKALGPALEQIRGKLGLPETCRLKAELHNLLVYAPGQFFVTHQDSEKAEDMIGTLVVSLPSKFTGGSFVIEHHDEIQRVGGSNTKLTLIAFYADCRHEVRPIKQGHRIVLTYNLIAEGGPVAAGSPEMRADLLTELVRDFFETPMPPSWSSDRDREPPDRLVYLLDHEYTQRGLAWNRLKNADAARAAALQEVARRLDCEILLALADVHETWTCEDDDYGYGYGRRRSAWGYDDDDDDDDESEDGSRSDESGHELIELVDGSVELRHWVGPGSRKQEAIAARVDDAEVCYTKPSVECEPFESEYEGFTGNAGNTVDRWYHRAAVVLWPRERNFVIRAKASPRWAVGEIGKTLRAGKTEQVLDQMRRVLPFWPQVVGRDDKSGLMEKTLRLAVELGDAAVAAELLAPFRMKGVTQKAAPLVARLLDRYGNAWCRKLVLGWTSEERFYEPREEVLKWLGSVLPALSRALCGATASDGPAFARWLLENRWAWTEAHIKWVQKNAEAREFTKTLARVGIPLLATIESCTIAKHTDLRDRMIAFLVANADDLPVQVPLGLLRAAHRDRCEALPDLGLLPLHEHSARMLATSLAEPARAADDWSIGTALRCSCKLCTTLSRFLRAPGESRFEWPLAKEGRKHVHGVIDSRDLPVLHKTRRTGRPFTLVLEKTAAVFERDAADRRLWAGELEWLEQTAAAFGST